MSFLSRKPARPDGRGRGDEYDDYGYADDGYTQSKDDRWSPDEYFSPEGIKGKWAGESPAGRSGGRGRREASQNSHQDSYRGEFDSRESGQAASAGTQGYRPDQFTPGVYDLPDGTDEDRGDRRRGRRKDREDRGERTGILRLRRDRGEDIWPDDGISDEDYWASVAADRPLTGTDSPLDNLPVAGGTSRPAAGPRPARDVPPSAGGTDRPLSGGLRFGGDQRGGDQRGGDRGDDQRGGDRGGAGRLGAPPGLSAGYQPGSGARGGPSQPGLPGGSGRAGSGPMAARPGTGPMAARPGTGPMAARPGTGAMALRPGSGPAPAVGVTASRPAAGPNGGRPGPSRSASGSGGLPQAPARPSFQPAGGRPAAGPGSAPGGRPQDWGERTERIERVNASGYPDPRPGSRGQNARPAGGRGPSGPLGLGGPAGGPGAPGPAAAGAAPGRGRGDNPAWRGPDRVEPDLRGPGRDDGRQASGGWPAAGPARGAHARSGDDDPLTSQAYSRAAMQEADGRSYRAAARRSQAQAKLTDEIDTYHSGNYQQQAPAQPARGGDYWQYRDAGPGPAQQPPGGRYAAPGGSAQAGGPPQPGHRQPGPGQVAPLPAPGHAIQPAFTPRDAGRPGQPGGGGHGSGPATAAGYPAQQPRPSQQQRAQQQPPGQPQLSPAGPLAAGAPGGYTPGGPGGARPAGSGGQNPYDSEVTASYPYSGELYPGPSALGSSPLGSSPLDSSPLGSSPLGSSPLGVRPPDGTDDAYYRPSFPDGSPSANHGQGRPGYPGGGLPVSSDRRY